MKVFFSMSFRGDIILGRQIYHELENLGYTHTSDSFNTSTPEEFYQWTNSKRHAHYEEVIKGLHETDYAILECSIHSITIGQMVQDCLVNEIPLLILVQDKNKLAFLDGLQEEKHKLVIIEYNKGNVRESLKEGLDYLTTLKESRFTMILPNKMIRFLDEVNKKTGISKSEYIRQLIEKNMGE